MANGDGKAAALGWIGAGPMGAVRHLLPKTDAIAALPSLICEDISAVSRLNVPLEPVGHSVGVTLSASRTPTPR